MRYLTFDRLIRIRLDENDELAIIMSMLISQSEWNFSSFSFSSSSSLLASRRKKSERKERKEDRIQRKMQYCSINPCKRHSPERHEEEMSTTLESMYKRERERKTVVNEGIA